ncbi:MAG: immune inhibitor A domain-containing protein, partial [Gemmatimonadota bacterium]
MRWLNAAGLMVVGLWAGAVTSVHAQQVGTRGAQLGRAEVPWLDWPANTAWKRRARAVRDARWSLIRSGRIGELNARPRFAISANGRAGSSSATAVTGSFFVPVIPIAYKDAGLPFPESDYQTLLFSTAAPNNRPYTLKTFYEELSRHRIQMSGRLFDTATMDSTGAFYEDGCNGIGVVNNCPSRPLSRFGLMIIAALDSISNRPGADTVWNDFDNDGPDGIPNSGDDDGVVDFVTFLHPTVGGECGTKGIWAHRFVVSAWNGGSPYVTKTPRKNVNGNPIPGQFIKVDNYTIQSSQGGSTACRAGEIMPIGTVAHETGHAFGLPDLYDTQPSSGTEGIGEWGLMGSGNYTQPLSPSSYDAWSLNELGWITVDTLVASRVVKTGPRELNDTIFLAKTGDADELYLIENRQPFHSDTALLNPLEGPTGANCKTQCAKQPGLLIWHIDLGVIAQREPNNQVNVGSIQGVALQQADGLNQLRTRSIKNRGDKGDPYPGSTNNIKYSLLTNPAARTNSNEYIGFIIDQIQQLPGPSDEMQFRFTRRAPSLVRADLPGALITVNGITSSRYEEVVPQGDQVSINVDPATQLTADGRSRLRFLSWSNGGPQNQILASGTKPDTIVASFAADYRLQVIVAGSGSGTFTASQVGDFTTGVFFPAGTQVTLTATPAQGS